MAQYVITHSCGHTETVTLFGPTKEREWKIQRMESEKCADCRTKCAEETDAAQGLAPFRNGSNKQRPWASAIRQSFFDTVRKQCYRQIEVFDSAERAMGHNLFERVVGAMDAEILTVLSGIANETDVRWVIDHRDASYSTLVKRYAADIHEIMVNSLSPDLQKAEENI